MPKKSKVKNNNFEIRNTAKLNYNELGYNKLPVIRNKFFSPKSMYNT